MTESTSEVPVATAVGGDERRLPRVEDASDRARRASSGEPRSSGLLAALAQALGSQAVLVGVGVGSLPILARNLGPAQYGGFSLFLVVHGLAAQLDVTRPLLTRDFASAEPGADAAPQAARGDAALQLGNTALLTLVAGLAGLALLGPLAGLALALGLALHAGSSRGYALLAASGGVGRATAARNVAWASATAATAGLSFAGIGANAWMWSFVAADLAILLAYRRMLAGHPALRADRTAGAPRSSESRLARRADVRDVLGHSCAVMVLGSTDKTLLSGSADALTTGRYLGQLDLAVKLHVVSAALGSVTYPILARAVKEEGIERAARRFVELSTRAALGYFAVILGLMLFHREVVGLVLGPDFAATAWLFPPMLVGIFVGLFGFLISNWQRARGDFRTHRRCYSVAAVVTVIAGLVLVPTLGAVGALWTFLCARCAELLLCVSEASYLPRAVLSRARIAAWAGLFLVLLAVAIRTSTANTAGAP